MSKKPPLPTAYAAWLADIKTRAQSAPSRAALAACPDAVMGQQAVSQFPQVPQRDG